MKEWIIGRTPVYEVLRARRRQVFRLQVAQGAEEKGRLAEIIDLAARAKVKVERVPRQVIDSRGENPQGVALETGEYPYSDLRSILKLAESHQEPPFVLILDTLQNPQNFGTLIRTAEAAGMHGVLIPFRRTASVTPAVVHASAGATEHLLVAQGNLAQMIETLKEAGAWVIGLEGGPEAQPAAQVRLMVRWRWWWATRARGCARWCAAPATCSWRCPCAGRWTRSTLRSPGPLPSIWLCRRARKPPGSDTR